MTAIVSTEGLSKSYGNVHALSDCTLDVTQGKVFGLLGPNGAGKSTFVRLLLGFLRPTAGRATVAGFDSATQSLSVRKQTAYLPGDARLFRAMRGRDVIKFFSSLRGEPHDKAMALADEIELDTARRVGWMSTGMRQKLALAVTVSSATPLLILDEPTANLDPTAREVVLRWVRKCREEGRSAIFSSHVMSEIEQTCDSVVILRAGKLVHRQEMTDLRQQHRIRAKLTSQIEDIPPEVRLLSHNDQELVVETETALSDVLQWLAAIEVESLEIEPVGLASVYQKYHAPTSTVETHGSDVNERHAER